MPEIIEVKIMAEYVNAVTKHKGFVSIRKSAVSKVKTELMPYRWKSYPFTISAEARGKEFKLNVEDGSLICNMGMSGNWVLTATKEIPAHAHLMLDTVDGYTLSLDDPRRFARWKWGDWATNRGPDPLTEWEGFIGNVLGDYLEGKNKTFFNKPIYETLMDQRYFNGIGNYLRAEILYRLDINPFISLAELFSQEKRSAFFSPLLTLCRTIPEEVYALGGGQLKDWTNPFDKDQAGFKDWLQCYKKKEMATIIDKKGRKFWYNPKYCVHL